MLNDQSRICNVLSTCMHVNVQQKKGKIHLFLTILLQFTYEK